MGQVRKAAFVRLQTLDLQITVICLHKTAGGIIFLKRCCYGILQAGRCAKVSEECIASILRVEDADSMHAETLESISI